MKLRQGQIWKRGEETIRIVRLERLQVEYKSTTDLSSRKGTHHKATKKEFCRLLKSATLQSPAETPDIPTPARKSPDAASPGGAA